MSDPKEPRKDTKKEVEIDKKTAVDVKTVDDKQAADKQKTKAVDELANQLWAKKLRDALRAQPAYLSGQHHDSALKYLEKENKARLFILRSSGFNIDPQLFKDKSRPDKLAWNGTHMIFGITRMGSDKKIYNHRYILGKDLSVTEVTVPASEWTKTEGSINEKSTKYRNLDALIRYWSKERGYLPVVNQANHYQPLNFGNYMAMKYVPPQRIVAFRDLADAIGTPAATVATAVASTANPSSSVVTTPASNQSKNIENIEDRFTCPITDDIIEDPVFIKGFPQQAFERTAIENWLKNHNSNPMTNEPVDLELKLQDPKSKQKEVGIADPSKFLVFDKQFNEELQAFRSKKESRPNK